MRLLAIGLALLLAVPGSVQAAPALAGKTNLTYDTGHGTQVEYYSADGQNYLWYPGNKIVLPGHWKLDGGSRAHPANICFAYPANSYNPVTHQYGPGWECEPMAVYSAHLAEQANGDVFGLASRRAVPFVLSPARTSIKQLEGRAR